LDAQVAEGRVNSVESRLIVRMTRFHPSFHLHAVGLMTI